MRLHIAGRAGIGIRVGVCVKSGACSVCAPYGCFTASALGSGMLAR